MFFRFFNLSYTFESNKIFFKRLLRDPTDLVMSLTPGTELHKAYLQFDPFQEDSTFGDVVEATVPLSNSNGDAESIWPEYLSFPDSYEVYTVFNSFVTSSAKLQESSEEWNWVDNVVTGTVMAKDFGRTRLGLNVAYPNYFISRGNPHIFKIYCIDETSVLVAQSNLEALEYDIDFFERVGIGDIVHAYCTSEECIGLGRGCILVKAQSE
jgi:hypothetical protein